MIYIYKRTMGRKCCVTNCNGNYDNYSKETVFRLPKKKKKRKVVKNNTT